MTASVHPPQAGLETTPHFTPPNLHLFANAYQRRLFGDTLPARCRIITALDNAATNAAVFADLETAAEYRRLSDKLVDCCRKPIVRISAEADEMSLQQQRCKTRLCPVCTRKRTHRLIARMAPLVGAINQPRFITLTMPHSDAPLVDQVKRLTGCFAKLRRSKEWRAHVEGGLYTIELKWSAKANRWHPHIHTIVSGIYFPHAQLKAAWKRISGATVVDVRFAHDRRKAVEYVVKYALKTADIATVPDQRLAEWALAVRGLRMAQTYGTLHAVKLEESENEERAQTHVVAEIEHVIDRADSNDPEAVQLLDTILALAARRVPDDDQEALENHKTNVRHAARCVRTFLGLPEMDIDNGTDRKHHIPRPSDSARDGPERLWEDDSHDPTNVSILGDTSPRRTKR